MTTRYGDSAGTDRETASPVVLVANTAAVPKASNAVPSPIATAQRLAGDVTAALAAGDFGHARASARALVAFVDALAGDSRASDGTTRRAVTGT